jgi:hypothetical protein
MQNPIVRTFKQLSSAEQARQELLAAGVPADDVKIDVLVYETGAVQGNFTVGDDPDVTGKTAYTHTYAPTAQDDVRDCMMVVNALDDSLAQRAEAILERHGALDPDPAHRAAQANTSRH